MRFDQIALLNPSIKIKKGALTPFLDMAALPVHGRDVPIVNEKPFTGSGARFQKGDTLIARITPCLENGKGAQIRHFPEEAAGFGSTEFIVARGKDDRDTDFIYYLTRHEDFRAEAIKRMEGTSGRQRVAWQQIASIEVPDVSSEDRREIAATLSALDDKIELNRGTAATLEEMASALYRSWFVDFDPVWAKAEGRTPAHMDEATAALFPDSFGDDGLPVDWKKVEIGEVLVILDSKRIPLSKPQRAARSGSIPYYGATSIMDYVDEAIFDEILLLIGEDGSVVKPNGKPFTQYIWGKSWVNNHAHVLKGKNLSVEQLKCIFDQVDIAPFVNGAVQAKLNQANLKRIPFIKAPIAVHEAFDRYIASWFNTIRTQSNESQTLTTLRDTLLPKLMSGELRVGEAQELIEAVV